MQRRVGGRRPWIRTLRQHGLAVLALGLSLPAAGLGCLFNPRDPVPPSNTDDPCAGSFPPAQNPIALRDRIIRSWQCRLLDSDYQDSLDEQFTYTPDANSVAHATPGFFDAWSRDREVATIQQALAGSAATRPSEVTVSFLLYRANGLGTAERPRYDVQYTVKLVLPDSSVVRYGGCADWELTGVTSPPVRLRTWADVNPFGTGVCTPVRPVSPAVGTTGFLRFDRGQ